MPLGESPITSFFSVVPKSKKRKVGTETVTKRKEARIKAIQASPVESSGIGKGKQVATKTSRHTSEHPSTPSSGSKHEPIALLQTPPATLKTASRTRKGAALEARSSPSGSNLNDSTKSTKFTTSMPTPLTKSRPKTRSISNALRDSNETPCKTMKPRISTALSSNPLSIPSHNTFSTSIDTSETIPSSQSQILLEPTVVFSLSHDCPPEAVKQSSTTSSHEISEAGAGVVSGYILGTDLALTVGSSQSQFLSPFDQSPPKRKRNADNVASGSRPYEPVDCIPSSQNQENELKMPWATSRTMHSNNSTSCQPSSSGWDYTHSGAPTRTLSDELFSVPIQGSVLVGIFQVENNPEEECMDVLPSEDANEGSMTESETEDESPPNRSSNLPPLQTETRNLHAPCRDPPCNPPDDHFQDRESLNSQDPSQSFQDSHSLPSVLQEFHDMFGSSDESYPPDFPMSLRS